MALHSLPDDIDVLSGICSGMSYKTVHWLFGEPDGELFGFWGDIYFDRNGQAVIIYYDEDGKAGLVKYGSWSETETKRQ